MPEPKFNEFRSTLARAGFSTRRLNQIVAELNDHYADLQDEARRTGMSDEEASSFAASKLGAPEKIANGFLAQEAACSWPQRFPKLAVCILPLVYFALLPAAPLLVGAESRARVCRWSAALMLSGAVTAAMFLGMQLAILMPQ